MNIFHILIVNSGAKIFFNILAILVVLVIGYLFGAFPTSIVIGKVFFHQDPRDYGSHNPGGTNAGRLWGKKVGFIIIVLDMLKTILPMWLCWGLCMAIKVDGRELCPTIYDCGATGINMDHLICWPVYWLSTIGCMIGHCWPIFAGMKGGKGVSCYMGVIVTSSWMFGFIPGLLYFVFLKITKYVSLTGILTGAVSSIMAWIWAIMWLTGIVPDELGWLPMYGQNLIGNWMLASILTIMTVIMTLRHHANIYRLINGCERRIQWMK